MPSVPNPWVYPKGTQPVTGARRVASRRDAGAGRVCSSLAELEIRGQSRQFVTGSQAAVFRCGRGQICRHLPGLFFLVIVLVLVFVVAVLVEIVVIVFVEVVIRIVKCVPRHKNPETDYDAAGPGSGAGFAFGAGGGYVVQKWRPQLLHTQN